MSGDARNEPMTLLVSVAAVRRLADPGAAIADAKHWSEHVGVVGDGSESIDDIRAIVDDVGADPDLVAGQLGGGLADIRQRLRSDRHVLVGAGDEQRAIATALGWEYQDVRAAAEAAGWELADDREP